MQPLFRRIAIHGTLAAVILALMGLGLAELASIWLAGSRTTTATGPGGVQITVEMEDASTTLRKTVPLRMAVAGFLLVILGETFLHFWRKRKPAAKPTAGPDDAERLLEQLLAEAEARGKAQAQAAHAGADPSVATPAPLAHSHPKV